jgi:hypothetical protein
MDWLRLVFVAVHVLAVTLPAIPSPPGRIGEDELGRRGARRTLAALRAGAAQLGLHWTHAEAAAMVAHSANAVVRTRNLLSQPFEPYRRISGARQSWRMFSQVTDKTARLEVYERRAGTLRPLYIALDAQHQWRGRTLGAERMRAYTNLFVSKTSKSGYLALVDWLACARKAEPGAGEGLRVQLQRLHIPDPEALRLRGAVLIEQPYWQEERVFNVLNCSARVGPLSDADETAAP